MSAPRNIPALSALLLFAVYSATMTLAGGLDIRHLYSAGINVAALFACFAIASKMLDFLAPARRAQMTRVAIHVAMAILFTFGWYALVLAGFAIGGDWMREGMVSRAFSQNSLVWQLHYGVTLYALLVLYRAWNAERATRPPESTLESGLEDILLRQGGEMVRVSRDEIVRISGAGDYAEIVTRSTRFMSSKSLDHFEEVLAPSIVRIHRSHLVRLGAIERAEPAGNGRVQLHLSNRDTVTSSRAGGKLLRTMVR